MKRNNLAMFSDNIRKTGGCWLWTGGRFRNGYGRFHVGGKARGAHRVAYEIENGAIPEGALVCHKCDVKLCVNPAHLYAGSVVQNAKDAVERDRYWSGTRQHLHKMDDDTVRIARALHAAGVPVRDLCEAFGVASRSTMWSAIKKETWKHIA